MIKYLSIFAVMSFCICSVIVWAQESSPNRVLSLDGDGDYVEMANSEVGSVVASQVSRRLLQ